MPSVEHYSTTAAALGFALPPQTMNAATGFTYNGGFPSVQPISSATAGLNYASPNNLCSMFPVGNGFYQQQQPQPGMPAIVPSTYPNGYNNGYYVAMPTLFPPPPSLVDWSVCSFPSGGQPAFSSSIMPPAPYLFDPAAYSLDNLLMAPASGVAAGGVFHFPTQSDSSSGYKASNNSSISPDGVTSQQQQSSQPPRSSSTSSAVNPSSSFIQQRIIHLKNKMASPSVVAGSPACHQLMPLIKDNAAGCGGMTAHHQMQQSFSQQHGPHQQTPLPLFMNCRKGAFFSCKPPRLQPEKPFPEVPLIGGHSNVSISTSSDHTIKQQQQQQQRRRIIYSNNILYKTILCNDFKASQEKFCPRGESCQFAHGAHDLHIPTRHQLYHSKMCTDLQNFGKCSRGPRCYHAHHPTELKVRNKPFYAAALSDAHQQQRHKKMAVSALGV